MGKIHHDIDCMPTAVAGADIYTVPVHVHFPVIIALTAKKHVFPIILYFPCSTFKVAPDHPSPLAVGV